MRQSTIDALLFLARLSSIFTTPSICHGYGHRSGLPNHTLTSSGGLGFGALESRGGVSPSPPPEDESTIMTPERYVNSNVNAQICGYVSGSTGAYLKSFAQELLGLFLTLGSPVENFRCSDGEVCSTIGNCVGCCSPSATSPCNVKTACLDLDAWNRGLCSSLPSGMKCW